MVNSSQRFYFFGKFLVKPNVVRPFLEQGLYYDRPGMQQKIMGEVYNPEASLVQFRLDKISVFEFESGR